MIQDSFHSVPFRFFFFLFCFRFVLFCLCLGVFYYILCNNGDAALDDDLLVFFCARRLEMQQKQNKNGLSLPFWVLACLRSPWTAGLVGRSGGTSAAGQPAGRFHGGSCRSHEPDSRGTNPSHARQCGGNCCCASGAIRQPNQSCPGKQAELKFPA